MASAEQELERAEQRMQDVRDTGYAVSARYDPQASRIVVVLNTGVELAVPVSRIEGLSDAAPEDLADIEVSPAGLGLHWPKLDADVYVPALLQGIFGSRRWMAAQLGAHGGKMKSDAKADAARANGRKGGRPRKIAS